MSTYSTNGFLVSLIEAAQDDKKHPEHGEAHTYLTKFRALEEEFFANEHPHVDFGLAISESEASGGSRTNIYTIHGCQHICDLIKSIDKLSKAVSQNLGHRITVLEAYILLCAAHVHDSANVSKRDGHPERCNEIITRHRDLFVSSVCQQIYDVASVHGGSHPIFGKDTFRAIDIEANEPPRLHLIAAMLRLADELSENEARVPEPVTAAHKPSERSLLAHAYARAFKNFELRNETLSIVYGVYPDDHDLFVEIDGGNVLFYDFLEEKINVIENEVRYCSQYGRPALNISSINFVVRRYEASKPSREIAIEKFTLHLNRGYPDAARALCERSEELSNRGVSRLSGFFVTTGEPEAGSQCTA